MFHSVNIEGRCLRQAGRYEIAALPSFGISEMLAVLDDTMQCSYLTVSSINAFDESDNFLISFDLDTNSRSSSNDKRLTATVLEVSYSKFPMSPGARCYKIRTPIILAGEKIDAEVWITELTLRSTSLVVGRNICSDRFDIDTTLRGKLGKPAVVPV